MSSVEREHLSGPPRIVKPSCFPSADRLLIRDPDTHFPKLTIHIISLLSHRSALAARQVRDAIRAGYVPPQNVQQQVGDTALWKMILLLL